MYFGSLYAMRCLSIPSTGFSAIHVLGFFMHQLKNVLMYERWLLNVFALFEHFFFSHASTSFAVASSSILSRPNSSAHAPTRLATAALCRTCSLPNDA